MSAISTVAVITAKEGSADQVETILRTLAEATHAESGCIRYSLQRGLQDPNVFVTVEKWDSSASLDAHLASEHVQAALGAAGELLAAQPQIIAAAPLEVGDPEKSAY